MMNSVHNPINIIATPIMKTQPDSLDQHISNMYTPMPNIQGSPSSKQTMQHLYRQQLDQMMADKERIKQMEKMRSDKQKREFNERAQQGIQAEKAKQQSYKNYYNMLMSAQSQHQSTYISPYQVRENLKESHINTGIEEERRRYQHFELEVKKREAEKKALYRDELLGQIGEKKRREETNRERELRQQQEFKRMSKLPNEISRYQKEKKKEEMDKYRQDLDRNTFMKPSTRNFNSSESLFTPAPQQHNILTNPLPFNIQNPYILAQIGQQNRAASKAGYQSNSIQQPPNQRQSYLALKGSQNLMAS